MGVAKLMAERRYYARLNYARKRGRCGWISARFIYFLSCCGGELGEVCFAGRNSVFWRQDAAREKLDEIFN
ncbi:MAG: hypothetical protein MPK06_04395 [Alphaproteobacteria bacterium]|nr:hypothetical protein [Alphaproteobacteria bacterium]MDA8005760.1 hypothetical protein [Alphaproteobacteria bacterium]